MSKTCMLILYTSNNSYNNRLFDFPFTMIMRFLFMTLATIIHLYSG